MPRIKDRRKSVQPRDKLDPFRSPVITDITPSPSWFNSLSSITAQTRSYISKPLKKNVLLIDSTKHYITPVALEILFPYSQLPQILRLTNMPEATFEQMMLKENAYRQLICNSFEIKEGQYGVNSALEAIITSLKPAIPSKCKEIATRILRGDIVDLVHSHSRRFLQHFNHSESALNLWSNTMLSSEKTIEDFELIMLSEVLEKPIHLYSYCSTCVTSRGKISPSSERVLGSQFHSKPIFLYYDPIRQIYHALIKKIHTT